MVLCNNVAPSDALRLFADARGHPVERDNYINAVMHHRSNADLIQAVRNIEASRMERNTNSRWNGGNSGPNPRWYSSSSSRWNNTSGSRWDSGSSSRWDRDSNPRWDRGATSRWQGSGIQRNPNTRSWQDSRSAEVTSWRSGNN
jgi:hypothetical protein